MPGMRVNAFHKQLLIELYKRTRKTVDDLPYTEEFERLYESFLQRSGLSMTRHDVWRAHLHFASGDTPLGAAEVKVLPFGFTQLARANDQQRGELERTSRFDVAAVAIDRAHELPNLGRINDRGVVRDDWGREESLKIRGDVA